MSATARHRDGTTLEIGSAFAGYRIDELLDRQEGDGTVYVATHLESERLIDSPPWPIALKVFAPSTDPGFLRRFAEVARLQSRLRSPNVVSVSEVGTSPAPFIAMTLFRGPSLEDLLRQREIDDDAALAIARDVAAGLEAGREIGLAYRNLTASRVLVTRRGQQRAFLGDFGAGRPADTAADVPSNVRALAAIVFRSLTGEAPGQRAFAELRPDLPERLGVVLERGLHRDPAARHPSPGELIEEVDAALSPGFMARLRRPRRPAPTGEPRRDRGEHGPSGRRGARPGVSRLTVGLAAAVIALAAIAGALVAPSPDAPAPVAARAAASGPLAVDHPADWRRGRAVPALPGLELENTVALAAPGAGNALVLGRAPGVEAGRLPRRLDDGLIEPVSREAVDLGGIQAYRYTGLAPRQFQGDEANLYLVPTTAGTVALECLSPPAATAFLDRCERVVSTLSIEGAEPIAVAPSPRYARSIRRTVERLDGSRGRWRARMRRARTRNGQAGAASYLNVVYRRAARSARGITPPPNADEAHALIVRSLSRAADHYGRMEIAARIRSRTAWNTRATAASAQEQRLERALGELGRLGYEVRGR